MSRTLVPAGAVSGAGRAERADRERTHRARRRKQALVGWLFALPFVLGFAIFMLIPLVSSFLMSFTDFTSRDVQNPFAVDFVGLQQYTDLFGNPQFRKSMFVTAYFVVVGIPLTMIVALALAVALNSGINRFRTAFRVGFYTPVVTSIVAVAVVWRFILQDDGLINAVLGWVGIDGPNWLNSTTWAMPAMILMGVWRNMGTLMIIFLAGLQTIPEQVKEAAAIDGAGPGKRFRTIIFPLLAPTTFFLLVINTVYAFFDTFGIIHAVTGGGPARATETLVYKVYNDGFVNLQLGISAAQSVILMVIVVALTAVQFRYVERRVHYG